TVDVGNAAGEEQAVPFRAVIIPNPSGQGQGAQLWIDTESYQALYLKVFDVNGRLLSEEAFHGTPGRTVRDLPPVLALGVYSVVITDAGGGLLALKWVIL
ncbi:MAG: T9SS type A sorting domain-containing protein, partial [Saprospiraceae bacterium]